MNGSFAVQIGIRDDQSLWACLVSFGFPDRPKYMISDVSRVWTIPHGGAATGHLARVGLINQQGNLEASQRSLKTGCEQLESVCKQKTDLPLPRWSVSDIVNSNPHWGGEAF